MIPLPIPLRIPQGIPLRIPLRIPLPIPQGIPLRFHTESHVDPTGNPTSIPVGIPLDHTSIPSGFRTFHVIIYGGITSVGSFPGVNVDTLTTENARLSRSVDASLFHFRYRYLKLIISFVEYINYVSFNNSTS